jgi:hypothetical protein
MDTGAYLLELQRMIAIHGSSLRAIEMAELEQRVSPSPEFPGVPRRVVGTDSIASSLGNTSPYVGVANALADSTFEEIATAHHVLTTSWSNIELSWRARYVLNGGTAPDHLAIEMGESRLDYHNNPANSATVDLAAWGAAAGDITGDITIELSSRRSTFAPRFSRPPVMVAGVRAEARPSQATTTKVTVELWATSDATDGSLVASSTLDLAYDAASGAFPPLVWASSDPATNLPWDHEWYVVYKIRVAYTNAHEWVALGDDIAWVRIFDPQLHQSWTRDPIPYAPLIGRWVPSQVVGRGAGTAPLAYIQASGSTYRTFTIDYSGDLAWGPGDTYEDARIYRSGTKTITADDNNVGAVTLNVIGQIDNAGTKVVGSRQTGWGAPTGTATRTTFATSTVTLEQLAERLHALIDDLTTHGLIGS